MFPLILAGVATLVPFALNAQTAGGVANAPTPQLFGNDFVQATQTPSLPAPTPSQQPIPAYPAPIPSPEPTPRPVRSTRSGPPAEPPAAYSPYDPNFKATPHDIYSSAYIPVDNWVYPEMARLYAMGFVDTLFLGLRPWTRRSVLHALEAGRKAIMQAESDEPKAILAALLDELNTELPDGNGFRPSVYGLESAYARVLGIEDTPLRDSFHLGETIANDYGRPYAAGMNSVAGFSTVAESGRFSFYMRAELQHAPAMMGYAQPLSTQLSLGDEIIYVPPNAPQTTIPAGALAAQNPLRIVEATLSLHLLGHEISGGKSDAWLGPAAGASMAWSNNAENIDAFRINRVEPLHIPLVSRVLGPVRYDFFYGSLKGHSAPNSPYVHAESLAFAPTANLQLGFERTIIFGGEGHAPVTLHLFLKGFFDPNDTTGAVKNSRNDPGARYSDFTLSYRLPFVRRFVTFYVDSISHDDVTPISAPRRAAYRTGLDLSHVPHAAKLELRAEAVSTDPDVSPAHGGYFNYWEVVQRQGYTNQGVLLGDWIGREAKGGQAWLTWHLAPKEWVELAYLNKKTPGDFIPGGTTQNQWKASLEKRFHRDLALRAWVQYEGWKAPVYKAGMQRDTAIAAQISWFLKLKNTDLGK